MESLNIKAPPTTDKTSKKGNADDSTKKGKGTTNDSNEK